MAKADRIEEQAARWVARVGAGPLSEAEREALDSWCAQDPRHLGAFVYMESVDKHLERAAALQGFVEPPASRRTWIAAAAAAALILAALGLWQLPPLFTVPVETRALATRIGEQYRANLADGSQVELNTATRLAVELKPHLRQVRMSEGEALFEVAKDARRPFVVSTDFGDVRAVGTQFSVRIDRGLEVLVSEGVVSIERDGKAIARVSAGERYRLAAEGEMSRRGLQPDEIERDLAWRDGKLAFAGETLAEAAERFNRYNEVKIKVVGPARDLRFGGYYRATDPQGFAEVIEESLPVDARMDGQVLTLSQKSSAGAQ